MSIIIKKSPTADSRTATGEVSKQELYDSSVQHINDVRKALCFFMEKLADAGVNHDYTKIDDPDGMGITAFYDAFSKKLTGDAFKAEKWFKRHVSEERHHVNDRCPNDVNLIDLLERIADITTAGMARSGSIYDDTLSPEILMKAYSNTIKLLKEQIVLEDGENNQ